MDVPIFVFFVLFCYMFTFYYGEFVENIYQGGNNDVINNKQ